MIELLGGSLDPATRAEWPAWARRHVAACRECRQILSSNEIVAAATRPTPPPPDFTALAGRLAERRVPDPGMLLAAGTAPRPARRYRSSSASGLELIRTADGVRAMDPDSTQIILFAVSAGGAPVVLARRDSPCVGVGLEATVAPIGLTSIVALSSCEKLDPTMWGTWLSDVFRSTAMPTQLPLGSAADRVHGAVIQVQPPLRRSRIRITDEVLPQPTPEVAVHTKAAAQAGRELRLDDAGREYRRARDVAVALGDTSGEIRAQIGMSQALHGLGYEDDAERTLSDVVDRFALDRTWADYVCRAMAWRAISRCDADAADAWLAESEASGAPDRGWRNPIRWIVAFLRGNDAEALHWLGAAPESGPAQLFRSLSARMSAAFHAGVGSVAAARSSLRSLHSPDGTLEDLLWRLLAEARLGEATSVPERELGEFLEGHPAVRFGAWDVPPLRALIRSRRLAGDEPGAAALLRLRFLSPSDALNDVPALVGTVDLDGLHVVEPHNGKRIRIVPVSREELRRLSLTAREEALRGEADTAIPALRALLFAHGIPPLEELPVASDGVLADIALPVLMPPGRPLPALYEVLSCIAERPAALAPQIASLADAWADLPSAAREVTVEEAAIFLRGPAVTRAALGELPPVGLLHIGVHSRREHGLPFLLFADGMLSPLDVSSLSLKGSPIVLLSGCATAVQAGALGVERSLADAFVRAGARAVIATRWPVQDREMHDLVKALIARWPFESAAHAVAAVASRFRDRGAHPRVWAALVVYVPQWRGGMCA